MLIKLFTNFKLLFAIVIIAALLRFFQLGVSPPSLDWDEASLGYNAYSILQTGADEYGNKFPSFFRSFGDYKPPLYVYLTVPVVKALGLNEFSTRFISAFFGTLTVLVAYFLVNELFKNKKLALVSSFLLAISPWHLQFSRAAFEANLALFFYISAILFFIKGYKNSRSFIISFILFGLAIYSYHSLRLIVPAFLLGIFIFMKSELYKRKSQFLFPFIVLGVMLIPILLNSITNLSRFSSVTVLTPAGTLDHSITQLAYDKERGDMLGEILHNRRVVYFLTVAKGYLDHYSPNFLFITGDGVPRHHPVDFGMLYLFELPFIIIGIFQLARQKGIGRFTIFWMFAIAPLASAITTGTPHPVRALTFLPTLEIFAALGALSFVDWSRRFQFRKVIFTLAILVCALNIIYYFHQYYVHTPIETSESWQYGSKELFLTLAKMDKNYDKVIVTYKYDQPYIFYLFYNKIDPWWYQKNWNYNGDKTVDRMRRIIGKYEFRNIDYGKDKNLSKTLIIGTPDEIPKEKALKEIKFLDGSVAFRIASG